VLEGIEIGKYHLERRIGRGGMAEVWAASMRGPNEFVKSVALKFISAHLDDVPESKRYFLQEARLAASFSHPNLVSVLDFDQIPSASPPAIANRHFIAMEYLDGGTLGDLIELMAREKRGLLERHVAYVAVEVLKGLNYLHTHSGLGLVHRDLSPHNVLLTRSGQVKISDFGVAKATATLSAIRSNQARGKTAYFAPEILHGAEASIFTDLFATGVVLWEAFMGRSLFSAQTEAATIANVLACKVPELRTPTGQEASGPFSAAVRKLLHPESAQRFSSAEQALEAFLGLDSFDPSPIPFAAFVRSAKAGEAGAPSEGLHPGKTERLPNADVALPAPPPTKLPGQAAAPPPTKFLSEASTSKEKSIGKTRPLFLPFVAGFDEAKLSSLLTAALALFESEHRAGRFDGSFEDWVIARSVSGIDPITSQTLPETFSAVVNWVRFAGVGWTVRLTPFWMGPRPWGKSGYWVAENALGNERMPIFAQDLLQEEFSRLNRPQWQQWWHTREVDIVNEGPLGKVPISERARKYLAQGEAPPRTRADWVALGETRDPEMFSTDIRVTASTGKMKRTFWQRLFVK
jgi:eukaryotic-like serine/threonine-protein kinase